MQMRNLKLTIEYDGTRFKGWQIQRQGERTVQEEIKSALKIILKESVTVIGSGRTDAGVHASGQVANFKTSATIETGKLLKAMNANLPPDISITEVKEVAKDFHAQFSATSKTYRYLILNREARSAFEHAYSLYYPFKLDLRKMRESARILTGKHDFRSFQASDPRRKELDTVRDISDIKIVKRGSMIVIDITADGFLYKMVRNIVGTFLEVGRGRLQPADVRKILNGKNRVLAGDTAKPHALTLLGVEYE